MESLTLDELKQIAHANGELDGWDFSRVHIKRAPVLWPTFRTLFSLAQQFCTCLSNRSEILLSDGLFCGRFAQIIGGIQCSKSGKKNKEEERRQPAQ